MPDKKPAINQARQVNKESAAYHSPEVWAKVTGRAVYGIDLTFPGMLYGKILRSPYPHALIKSIDITAAEAMPGVRAVLTGPDLHCKPYGIVIDDELPLAVDRVRYCGDEVAAVAAVDQKTAEMALKKIKVDYEILPAVYTPREALAPGAIQLHENFPGNLAWERNVERGNPDTAFREADLVVESSFSIPSISPGYLEPIACVAANDCYRGLILHTALQSPDMVRKIIADTLEMPLSKVNIVGPVMGGGFGGRVYGNLKLYLLSALLSIKTGMPVKMQLTREEEFKVGRPMIAAEINLKMALRRDGTILARQADILTDNGAYSAQAPWVSKTLSERNDSVYRIKNIKTRVRLVYTNKVPTGQYRAYGNQAANFASESLIDMAAQKLGLDPLEIRLKNCTQSGDLTVHGLKIESCALAECLKRAAAEIGWKKKKGRGYGISAAIHANGSVVFDNNLRGAAAQARLELDGRVTLLTGEQDYGQGVHATFAIIAAKVLNIPPERITVLSKDTCLTPFSLGALAMRQTTIGGKAIELAAESLKEKMLKSAFELTGRSAQLKDGLLRTASGEEIDLAKIAVFYHGLTSGLTLSGDGAFVPPKSDYDQGSYGNIAVTYSFAAHAAEVEIDRVTGALIVHRIVAVHDSGKIINRTSARGQVLGGVAQGLGIGCLEGYVFDNGQVANASLAEYRMPTALDMPDISPHFIEYVDPVGPFGAKGMGEIVQVPVAGALANAVADAAGVWVKDLPITAEKIYHAISGLECI